MQPKHALTEVVSIVSSNQSNPRWSNGYDFRLSILNRGTSAGDLGSTPSRGDFFNLKTDQRVFSTLTDSVGVGTEAEVFFCGNVIS